MNEQATESPETNAPEQEQVNRPVVVIKPTVGRVVWFWPQGNMIGGQPCAAIIAYVHSDRCVNIGYLSPSGLAMFGTSVTLVQEGEPYPNDRFCEWTPYQKEQAARTERIERRLMNDGHPAGGIGVG